MKDVEMLDMVNLRKCSVQYSTVQYSSDLDGLYHVLEGLLSWLLATLLLPKYPEYPEPVYLEEE